MRKRWLIGIVILIAGCLALAWTFPATIYVPLGLVRREAFFDGKPTNYWIRGLQQEGFLGHAPPGGDHGQKLRDGGAAAVPVLCEIAENPDDNLRMEALNALALMGPPAKAAEPVLSAALKNEQDSTHFLLASEALGKVDPAAAAQQLSAIALDAAAGSRRAWALAALLNLAPKGQEAVPLLEQLLHDDQQNEHLRVMAANVLWRMKQPAELLVAALCALASAKDSSAGAEALTILGEMGPAAKSAVPALVKLLQRPSLPQTGQRWGPPHRHAVVLALGQIGPEARAAVPALIASLKSGNSGIRTEVALALAHIDGSAKEALAARDAIRATSITLLAAGPTAQLAVPSLVQIFRRTWIPRDLPSRSGIRQAIERIDPSPRRRLPPM